ncbi:MAG: hypothetical protein HQL98_12195 [Magnetococcales bacterium]|nr:hypothetical protein [Magnetococcales bacterium]
MASFRVLTPLHHDGVSYAPGAIVPMAAAAADRAVAIQAVSPLEPIPGEPERREPAPGQGQTASSLPTGKSRASSRNTGRKTP